MKPRRIMIAIELSTIASVPVLRNYIKTHLKSQPKQGFEVKQVQVYLVQDKNDQ